MAPERPGGEDEPIPVALGANHSVAIPVTLLSIPNTLLHIKEGDGASEDRSEKGSEDDDLTSLTWLQDKNLLKGINLRTSGTGVQESPTSDYVDDSASERDSTCSSGNTCPSPPPPSALNPSPLLNTSKYKHPNHIPYDPKIHTSSKPPYSFSCLIFMAIEDSPAKALPVKEIYGWILEHFPFYKNAPTGWKNSVRHNLSLNKCFRKVDKAPVSNLGKGSLWMVDPLYRSNLMQTLQKAPYHPCASLHNPPTAQPSSTQKAQQPAATKVNGTARLPDPELFPYLSRRLAAAEASDPLDDVHAAAAMLQLKHGPSINLRREEYHRRFGEQLLQAARGVKRKIKAEILHLENSMLITSSPSEDHTYSSAERNQVKNEPASPDEAFADGSDSDSSWAMPVKVEVQEEDMEEQRKIAEGADALLNLAGITTAQPQTPFRPRMLRKQQSPPQQQQRNTDTKTRWKLAVENNNNVQCEPRPPAKIRRKLAAQGANKMKR